MSEEQKTIFREKNLKKAAEPDALNDYLKVTGFSAWFVVIAAALILAAVFLWAVFGKVTPVISGAGYCSNGMIKCYFEQSRMEELKKGAKVDVEGNTGIIEKIGNDLYMEYDIPYEVLFLLPKSDEQWYSYAMIRCDTEDGLYKVNYQEKEIRPISFMAEGSENNE